MYYSKHNTKLNSISQFHSTNITYQLLLITTHYYNLTTSSPCTVWSTLHSAFLFTLSFTGFKIVVSPLHWYNVTQQFQTQVERSSQIYYSPVTRYYKFTATPTCYNIQPHLSQIKVTFTYKSSHGHRGVHNSDMLFQQNRSSRDLVQYDARTCITSSNAEPCPTP